MISVFRTIQSRLGTSVDRSRYSEILPSLLRLTLKKN